MGQKRVPVDKNARKRQSDAIVEAINVIYELAVAEGKRDSTGINPSGRIRPTLLSFYNELNELFEAPICVCGKLGSYSTDPYSLNVDGDFSCVVLCKRCYKESVEDCNGPNLKGEDHSREG